VDLTLNLKKHCIASEIKKLYNKSVSTYLKKSKNNSYETDPGLEATIELLKKALEQLDLPGLRNRYPVLAGKTDTLVTIGLNNDQELSLTIENQIIKLLFLNEKKKCTPE